MRLSKDEARSLAWPLGEGILANLSETRIPLIVVIFKFNAFLKNVKTRCEVYVESGPCPSWIRDGETYINRVYTSGTRREAEEGDGGWPEPEARSRPHEQTNKTNRNVLGTFATDKTPRALTQ